MRILLASIYRKGTLLLGWHCEQALRRLGHEVEIFDLDCKGLIDKVVLSPMNRLSKKLRKQNIEHPVFERYRNPKRSNRKLIEAVERFRPHVLFVLKGADFTAETIRTISRNGVRTARWWLDDPRGFERSMEVAHAYDYYFTMDPYSVDAYKRAGLKRVYYLPFACDREFYRPLSLTARDRRRFGADLCFVGNWLIEREALLSKLLHFNLKIWGPGWKKRLGHIPDFRRSIQGPGVYGQNVVKVYNAARINLNIHAWIGRKETGVNMRVFEIPACGGFLLTDYNRELENHLIPGEEIATFRDVDELKEHIDYYLGNEDERIKLARRGYERIRKGPDYVDRMRVFLSYLEQ